MNLKVILYKNCNLGINKCFKINFNNFLYNYFIFIYISIYKENDENDV